MGQRLGGALQLVLGLARLDHRAVERRQRLRQQFVLARDPVELAGRAAQAGDRRVRARPQVLQVRQVVGQPLPLLHRRAGQREFLLLALDRRQRAQFGEVGEQQVLFLRRRRHPRPRRVQRLARGAPRVPCRFQSGPVGAGIAIEQGAVAARIDEAAIVMLAVDLDERPADLAQQRDPDRLVVDERLAAAVSPDLPPRDERLARLDLHARVVERTGDHGGQPGELERRGHARALLARAHEAAVGAVAEDEAQRVEQDRLARPGLTRKHAEALREIEIERLDQDDVTDGKPGEHVRGVF